MTTSDGPDSFSTHNKLQHKIFQEGELYGS